MQQGEQLRLIYSAAARANAHNPSGYKCIQQQKLEHGYKAIISPKLEEEKKRAELHPKTHHLLLFVLNYF